MWAVSSELVGYIVSNFFLIFCFLVPCARLNRLSRQSAFEQFGDGKHMAASWTRLFVTRFRHVKQRRQVVKTLLEVAPTIMLLIYSFQLMPAFQPPKRNRFSQFRFHQTVAAGERSRPKCHRLRQALASGIGLGQESKTYRSFLTFARIMRHAKRADCFQRNLPQLRQASSTLQTPDRG